MVITIEPQGITIQNVGGPDRSISAADINRCELLISRHYRNRRLGEYLKELDMTEGRSTGIPTIQNVLKANGSPRAILVTDDDRTFFRLTIPCHEAAGNIIADIAEKDKKQKGTLESTPENTPVSTLKGTPKQIFELLAIEPTLTIAEIAGRLNLNRRGVVKHFNKLKSLGIIRRVGPNKGGHWEIINET